MVTRYKFANRKIQRDKGMTIQAPTYALNLQYGHTADIWRINLWGKNITDEEYLEEVIPAPEFGGSFIHDSYGRSFGVNLSRTF
mgnify:CR=1 FL=1